MNAILIMFWIIGFVSLIAGLVLLKLGLWPRRRGDTPYCRKCGYNLTGLISDRCPECGTTISPGTTLRGERHRSTGKIILGNAILILALAWLAAPLAGMNTWRLYPTFMVIPYLQSNKYTTAQTAWDEISRRAAAGKLSPAQCRAVFAPFNRPQLMVRPEITRGDPVVVDVRNTAGNWAGPRNIFENVRLLDARLDKQPMHFEDQGCSNFAVGHAFSRRVIPFAAGPGKHDVKVAFSIERYYCPAALIPPYYDPSLRGVLLDRTTMTLEDYFKSLATRPANDVARYIDQN